MKKEDGFWRGLWENSKTSIALFLGSVLFVVYSVIAIRYELGQGWSGHPSLQNVLLDISRFIPVAGAFVATLILFISEAYKEGYIDGQQDKDSEDDETELEKVKVVSPKGGETDGKSDIPNRNHRLWWDGKISFQSVETEF